MKINKEYKREYYKRNREKLLEKNKKYIMANKEKYNKTKKRHRTRVYEFIISLKNQPCADCGQKFPHYIMEFDHIRGKREEKISDSQGISAILKEIEKCDLVCANCHCTREWIRRQLTEG